MDRWVYVPVFGGRKPLTISASCQLAYYEESTPQEALENQRAYIADAILTNYPGQAQRLLAELEEVTLQCRLMLL